MDADMQTETSQKIDVKSKSLKGLVMTYGCFLMGIGLYVIFWIIGILKSLFEGDLSGARLIARLIPRDLIQRSMVIRADAETGPIIQYVELPEVIFLMMSLMVSLFALFIAGSLARLLLTTGYQFILLQKSAKKKKEKKSKKTKSAKTKEVKSEEALMKEIINPPTVINLDPDDPDHPDRDPGLIN